MDQPTSSLTRRDLLKLGGTALAVGATAAAATPGTASAQTPKHGGTFRLRSHVAPVHFDPHQTIAFSTMIPLSFAYSRLVKVKGGSAVVPGTQPVENDLAESWERQGDTVYVLKLRKGVRWHNKPPVNGRELTAEDVRYTYDRFLNLKGNSNKFTLEMVDKVEALDKYTVKFTLREPNAWFIDRLASTSTWIIAKECVDQYGDLKRPESIVGTGPWMYQSYEPNVRMTFVRNPSYFVPGLPYVDGVDITLSQDPAAAFAQFLSGDFDFGPEYGMVIRRSDLDIALRRVKGLGMRDYIVVFGGFTAVKLDQEPFKDVRVRRAFSMSQDWREVLETNAWSQGKGAPNPLIPAALKEWSIPFDKLGEGAKYYKHDPAEAKRLLAAAGYPNGFPGTMCFTTYGNPVLVDIMQLVQKDLKTIGIDTRIDQKEYGAYISTCFYGKFDSMTYGPQTGFLEPDNFLFGQYYPEELKNQSHINDPVVADMLVRQRRTLDPAKRREIIYDIQRHLAQQQYYVQMPSAVYVAVWEGALKNYAPNMGYDYGGRLMAAWLDR